MAPRGLWVSCVFLLGVAVLATPADAARGQRVRIKRVQKVAPIEELRIAWVQPRGARELQITREQPIADGSEFDIIDQRGYLGRVRVSAIEPTNTSCPGVVYYNGVGRLDRGELPGDATTLALTVTRVDLGRARVLVGQELRAGDLPDIDLRQQQVDIGVDLDGDGHADLVRYQRQCTGTPGGPAAFYCIDTWRRDRKLGWKLHDTLKIAEC